MKNNESSNAKSTGTLIKKEKQKQSEDYGIIGFVIFFIIIIVYNFFKGLPVYDLLSLFWGCFGATYLSKYLTTKSTLNLIAAIFGLLAAIIFLANYMIKTW
jgi:hypothetical protein